MNINLNNSNLTLRELSQLYVYDRTKREVRLRKMSPPTPATPSRAELRALVLSYLSHYSFVDTAQAFSKEVPLKGWYEDEPAPDFGPVMGGAGGREEEVGKRRPEDVRLTEQQMHAVGIRRDIREHILLGQIKHARALIREHFPSVLPPPPQQPEALDLADDPEPGELPSSSTPTAPAPPTTQRGREQPPFTPSKPLVPEFPSPLTPEIIDLTLSLQEWIEQLRTVPIPYPASPGRPSTSHPQPSQPAPPRPASSTPTAQPPSATPSQPLLAPGSPPPSPSTQIRTLRHLYAHTNTPLLPPLQSQQFREDIIRIAGLMAYRSPESAPEGLRGYLEGGRRVGVGRWVNAAVLEAQHMPPSPPLGSLVRQLTWVYEMLHEMGIRPPETGYPAGVDVSPTAPSEGGDRDGDGDGEGGEEGDDVGNAEGEGEEWEDGTIPEFDLSRWLYQSGVRGRYVDDAVAVDGVAGPWDEAGGADLGVTLRHPGEGDGPGGAGERDRAEERDEEMDADGDGDEDGAGEATMEVES